LQFPEDFCLVYDFPVFCQVAREEPNWIWWRQA